MIAFFRRIRFNLIQKNKSGAYRLPVGRYFKYALGEIILVVIGILIALYINNLNTEKQESRTLNGYLHNIGENIASDQLSLRQIANFRDSSIIGSNYFMNMMEQASKEQYSLYFSRYFKFNPWLDESFQSNQSGFEALKNAGYLTKIQQTNLESQLYTYYNLIAKIKAEEQSLNNFMEEMEYDLYKNNIVQKIKPLIKKLQTNTASQEDFNELQRMMNFPSFIGSHSRNAGTRYMNKLYDRLVENAVKLQQEIEKITTD